MCYKSRYYDDESKEKYKRNMLILILLTKNG